MREPADQPSMIARLAASKTGQSKRSLQPDLRRCVEMLVRSFRQDERSRRRKPSPPWLASPWRSLGERAKGGTAVQRDQLIQRTIVDDEHVAQRRDDLRRQRVVRDRRRSAPRSGLVQRYGSPGGGRTLSTSNPSTTTAPCASDGYPSLAVTAAYRQETAVQLLRGPFYGLRTRRHSPILQTNNWVH